MTVNAEALADRLDSLRPGDYHVVCLPDFFLDHFVALPPWGEAVPLMERVHAQGGGNVQDVHQHFATGGNAANTALALARLGVRAHLVTRTSAFGKETLERVLGVAGVDLTRVKDDGDLAITTALEFGGATREGTHAGGEPSPEGQRNVMLSYPGSVADFGFDGLDESDITLIEGSDAVLVANWSQNPGGGTALVREVARVAAASGTLAYVDTGDPSGRAEDVPAFVRDVLEAAPVAVLAVNENELRYYADRPDARDRDAYLDAGARLAARLPGCLDVHTSRFAAAWTEGGDGPAVAPTFPVRPRRLTGAGDAWNAGNLLGHVAGLDPAERLMLANATAAYYIASEDGHHPSLKEVAAFVRSEPPRDA